CTFVAKLDPQKHPCVLSAGRVNYSVTFGCGVGLLFRSTDRGMAQTASEVMVETLIDWGVDTIFGIPGDGINGIMEALRKAQDKIRFIQTRHEEAAAFMACGYAKFTGKLGV